MADLSGRVCLVTGGRTKIGYRCALKLLRCGAYVIVTTRFPVNATSRYAAEKDSQEWMDRLQVGDESFALCVCVYGEGGRAGGRGHDKLLSVEKYYHYMNAYLLCW